MPGDVSCTVRHFERIPKRLYTRGLPGYLIPGAYTQASFL